MILNKVIYVLLALFVSSQVFASTFLIGGVVLKVSEGGFSVVVTEVIYVNGSTAVGDVVHFTSHKSKNAFKLPMSFVVDGHAIARDAALVPGRKFVFFAKGGGFAGASCARDGHYGIIKSVQSGAVELHPLPKSGANSITLTVDDHAAWSLDGSAASVDALQSGAWAFCMPAQPQQVFAYSTTPSLDNQPAVHQHSAQGMVQAVVDPKTFTIQVHGASETRTVKNGWNIVRDGLVMKDAKVAVGQEMLGWCYRNRDRANFIGLSNPRVRQGVPVSVSQSELTVQASNMQELTFSLQEQTVFHLDGKPVDALPEGKLAWVQVVPARTQAWDITHFPLQQKSVAELTGLLSGDSKADAAWQLSRLAHVIAADEAAAVIKAVPGAMVPADPSAAKAAALILDRLQWSVAAEVDTVKAAIAEACVLGLESLQPASQNKAQNPSKELGHAVRILGKTLLRFPQFKDSSIARLEALGLKDNKAFRAWFK